MFDWIFVFLLGVVEGITEFLPVSSTAHLLIVEDLFSARRSDMFNVVIQAGAVLAVVPAFWGRVTELVAGFRQPENTRYLLKIGVAFLITSVGGSVLDKAGVALPETVLPVAVALFAGGVLFLIVEHMIKGRVLDDRVSWPVALMLGVAQVLAALFPGISRSGACILTALVMGVNRPRATEFSFLLGVPTMIAAGALKLYRALSLEATAGGHEPWALVVFGFVVSAVVSFLAVRWLLRYVQTHTFMIFGWYRMALAVGLVTWFFFRH